MKFHASVLQCHIMVKKKTTTTHPHCEEAEESYGYSHFGI